MSRKFLVLLFAAFGLTVAACGDKDGEETGGDSAAASESES